MFKLLDFLTICVPGIAILALAIYLSIIGVANTSILYLVSAIFIAYYIYIFFSRKSGKNGISGKN